jgi:hypothetical protein
LIRYTYAESHRPECLVKCKDNYREEKAEEDLKDISPLKGPTTVLVWLFYKYVVPRNVAENPTLKD